MSDQENVSLIREALLSLPRSDIATSACLADDAIAALVDGLLEEPARAAAVGHLARCDRCRAAVASVARALGDASVRSAAASSVARAGRRWFRIAVPLAAAAVLLVLVWAPRRVTDGTGHRSPPVTEGRVPVPASPVGAVGTAGSLVWTSIGGAEIYRVTLFDADGHLRFETRTTDTVVVLPDTLPLTPGRPYVWKVEARTGWDRWVGSPIAEFVIFSGARR